MAAEEKEWKGEKCKWDVGWWECCVVLTRKLEKSVTCDVDARTLKGVEFNVALLDEWVARLGVAW